MKRVFFFATQLSAPFNKFFFLSSYSNNKLQLFFIVSSGLAPSLFSSPTKQTRKPFLSSTMVFVKYKALELEKERLNGTKK